MKNYFIKYSNYFILLGIILLGMYFTGYVPYRLRNVPDSSRLFVPILFVLVGIAGKFIDSESYGENKPEIYLRNNDIDPHFKQFSKPEPDKLVNEKEILTPQEWLKQNPGKSINDYYKYRNS